MNPRFQPFDFGSYTSASQMARVRTEHWAEQNLYCAACEEDSLRAAPNNTKAYDFACEECAERYQLKAGKALSPKKINDGAYRTMLEAVRSDRVPNLIYMGYVPESHVQSLVLVPRFFFTEACVIPRRPLEPPARRAVWQGCVIDLESIPSAGRIWLIQGLEVATPQIVRHQYSALAPIQSIPPNLRGWTLAVFRCVLALGKQVFALGDLYAFEAELEKEFPGNRNIRPKIRQQLQVLRDLGFLRFLGSGHYELVASFG